MIMFQDARDIEDFANKMSKYPYDMDLKRGRFIVDAKSILSIMNMGVHNKIEFKVHEDEEDLSNLWGDIKPYMA